MLSRMRRQPRFGRVYASEKGGRAAGKKTSTYGDSIGIDSATSRRIFSRAQPFVWLSGPIAQVSRRKATFWNAQLAGTLNWMLDGID
jgi:hypothetical protein